jgi:ParB-like chromosome segregation protein Spo0J
MDTEKDMSFVEQTWEWVDINLLKIDLQNPNSMSADEKKALWQNIQRFGWNMPIVTDMKYLIADGQQKLEVAKEHGLSKVPVLRKNITDVERRILRQSMNKLRGTHDEVQDAEEFKRILESVSVEEFTGLTAISEQEVINLLQQLEKDDTPETNKVDTLYKVQVECPNCHFKFEKKD